MTTHNHSPSISPPSIVEVVTGFADDDTQLEDCIRSVEEICDGKHDAPPGRAFMYVGSVEEAVGKAKKLQG